MNAILEQVYPWRIEAIEALRATENASNSTQLRDCAGRVRRGAERFGGAPAAVNWRAFGNALDIAALLVDWRNAVRGAEPDADRFRQAAKLRFDELASENEPSAYTCDLIERLGTVRECLGVGMVSNLLKSIATLAMPLSVFSDQSEAWRASSAPEHEPKSEEIIVAFVEFIIDGKPAETVHSLQPNQVHDLDVRIRVSRWPEGSTSLRIRPISIEPRGTWELPSFEFTVPEGKPPYFLKRQGRMIVHAPQGLNARPLEFIYAAEFNSPEGALSVVTAGQRELRLDGMPSSQTMTGYRLIDRKILELRDRLRSEPLVPEEELATLLTLLKPLGMLMGQAVQDARYTEPIDERTFQADLRQILRSDPAIGAALEEQPNVAGGRADLSFQGLRIEVKSEPKKRLAPEACTKFVGQTTSYAVGTGRRIGLLCILDCSPKSEPPFPMDQGLFIQMEGTGTSATHVVTCLVQGNLAKPSMFSR